MPFNNRAQQVIAEYEASYLLTVKNVLLFKLYFCLCYASFHYDEKSIIHPLTNYEYFETLYADEILNRHENLINSINSILSQTSDTDTSENMVLDCSKVVELYELYTFPKYKKSWGDYELNQYDSKLPPDELEVVNKYKQHRFDLGIREIDINTDNIEADIDTIQEILDNFQDSFLILHDEKFDPAFIYYRSKWFNDSWGKNHGYDYFLKHILELKYDDTKLTKYNDLMPKYPLNDITRNGVERYKLCEALNKEFNEENIILKKQKKKRPSQGNLERIKILRVNHHIFETLFVELQGAINLYNSFQYSDINDDNRRQLAWEKLDRKFKKLGEILALDTKAIIPTIKLNKFLALYNTNQKIFDELVNINKDVVPDVVSLLQFRIYLNQIDKVDDIAAAYQTWKNENTSGGSNNSRLHWLFYFQGIFVVAASAFYSTFSFE